MERARVAAPAGAGEQRPEAPSSGGFLPVLLACVVLHTAACSTEVVASGAAAVTRADGAAGATHHPADASSLQPADSGTPHDAGATIDCVKAGGGSRRDAAFLPGLFTARIDLASYCATFGCPYRSIRDFLDVYSCSPVDSGNVVLEMPRTVGCGLDTVGGIGLFGGSDYVFDAETGALVGASIGSDTTFGPCKTGAYVAGGDRPPCSTETLEDCRPIP